MKHRPQQPAVRKRVLIVDDHPVVREGLSQVINEEADLMVCGMVASARQALTAVEQLTPDVVVADITLEDSSGLELIKNLKATHPHLPVLALSMHDEALYAERVLRAGGRGYVMKAEAPRTLLTALRAVLRGEIHVSEPMKARILQKLAALPPAAGSSRVEQFTDRELEVYELLGRGLTTREIAARLNLSFYTVCSHRDKIKVKLGIATANELVNHAMQWTRGRPTD